MQREIERVTGRGDVFREESGARIGRWRYDLMVLLDETDTGTEVGGTIEPDGLVHGLRAIGKSLVLHLEDGRRLTFCLQSPEGAFTAQSEIGKAKL